MVKPQTNFLHRLMSRVNLWTSKPLRNKEIEEIVTDISTDVAAPSVVENGSVVASDAPAATPDPAPPTPEVPPAPSETPPGGAPAPEPAAPAETPAPPAEGETETTEAKNRRGRGALEADVKVVCDQFVTGGLVLTEGDHLTAHKIANKIKEMHGLDAPPSSGAVTAVMDRWKEVGYAELNEKPKAFSDYTDAGRTEGLTALKAKAAEAKRAERAAEKAAKKAAEAESSEASAPAAAALGEDSSPADSPAPADSAPPEDAPF